MEAASASSVEFESGGSHDDHGRDVQRHQGLGVGVVAEQHLAAEAAGGLGDLGPGVPDEVHVGVRPLEGHGLLAVPRVDVGDRKPAERRPPGLGERLWDHGSFSRRCVWGHRSLSSASTDRGAPLAQRGLT